jgi:hypothetical protein
MEEIDRAIATVDEILSQMPAGLAAR